MYKIIPIISLLLLLGVSCAQQPSAQSPSALTPAVQEEEKQEIFDTNDYLDEALKELDESDDTN